MKSTDLTMTAIAAMAAEHGHPNKDGRFLAVFIDGRWQGALFVSDFLQSLGIEVISGRYDHNRSSTGSAQWGKGIALANNVVPLDAEVVGAA